MLSKTVQQNRRNVKNGDTFRIKIT